MSLPRARAYIIIENWCCNMYMKTNSKEFRDFIRHLDVLGHSGHDAMLATMHECAEDGLETIQDSVSMRTQERTGRLLDSFTMGNKLNVYDVGEENVVFGSALYYAQMVDRGHAIVPPGYRRDYRRQKRRKKENQRYEYYEGAHFFDPAFQKITRDTTKRMARDLDLIVEDTSFIRRRRKKKRRKKAY